MHMLSLYLTPTLSFESTTILIILWELLDILPNIPFATCETKCDY